MTSDFAAILLGTALAVALFGLAGLALAYRDAAGTVADLFSRLDYDVVCGPAGVFDATPLPTWAAFADRVLANPALAAHHDRVRRDGERFATLYAGKTVFVLVRRLPG